MQKFSPDAWFGAISDNDLSKVTLLLDQGINVNAMDDNGWSALHIAVYKDFTDLIALLINRGADIQQKMQNRSTALKIALNRKYVESIKLLLSAGAHFDPMALHYAAEHGYQEIVQLLLDAGADVHIKNKDSHTPLECALRNGHMHIVELLIAYGADAWAKQSYDLLNSVMHNDIAQLKKVLLQGVDPNIKNAYCPGTVLHIAVYYGHQELVQLLIAHGAKMNPHDKGACYEPLQKRSQISSREALERVIHGGQIEIIKLLLFASKDLQICEEEFFIIALKWACNNNLIKERIDIVKLFVEYGVDVNLQNYLGTMPLSYAVIKGHLEIVQLLLEAGANVQAENEWNDRPLDSALQHRRLQIAELLIAYGAVSSKIENVADLLKTIKNNIDWFEAINSNDITRITTWLAQGFDPNSEEEYGPGIALHCAAMLGYFELTKLLIAHKANVNAKDCHGYLPIHYAAANNFANIVTLLITNGAEIDAKNEDYDSRPLTALQIATHEGHIEVVELLLANGANISVIDEESDAATLLHQASGSGYEKIVELLIKNGINVNAKARYDYTPLYWAAGNNLTNIVELLIIYGAEVDARDEQNCTALFDVSRFGCMEVARLLLAHGADVNAKSFDGLTPLHCAIWTGKKEIVALLLEKGADCAAQDKDGKMPGMIALENGHGDIAKLLEQHQKNK